MARTAKPRCNKPRSRWYAYIGDTGPDGRAREVFSPTTIGERDEAGAWEWIGAELSSRKSVPIADGEILLEAVCEQYLAWCEARMNEGKLAVEEYRRSRWLALAGPGVR